MKRIFDELYLLFIARQGYWESIEQIKIRKMWLYLFPYLFMSVILLFMIPSIQEDLILFLDNQFFFELFPYRYIMVIFLNIVIPIGLAYENFYVYKTNTPMTLKLFFNISSYRFEILLLLKNLILISPILVILMYYKSFLILIILIATQFSSRGLYFFILEKSLSVVNLKTRLHYVVSIVDYFTILKTILLSIFSMIIFYFIFKLRPEIINFKSRTLGEAFCSGIFLGSVFYGHKGIPYTFLSLINDLPYLKAIGINVTRFLNKNLFLLISLPFLLSIPFFVLLLSLLGFDWIDIIIICSGVLFGYLVLQGIQIRESLYFRDKLITSVKELAAYRFPVKHYLFLWSSRVSLILVSLLGSHLSLSYIYTSIILLSTFLIYWFVRNYTRTVSEFVGKINI